MATRYQINGVPKTQYGFNIGYHDEDKYYFHLLGNGKDRMYIDQSNIICLDNSLEVSLSAGGAIVGLNLGMNIDNLFNFNYCYSGYWDPLIEQARFYPSQGRNITIRLSRNF